MTFDGSIFPSSESPLVNDLITIRISWLNQGTADAGQYRVTLEDLTEGTTLYDGTRSSLISGSLDSLTLYHTFSSTGDHDMRLTVDVDSDIDEVNDESNGVDNNIWIGCNNRNKGCTRDNISSWNASINRRSR